MRNVRCVPFPAKTLMFRSVIPTFLPPFPSLGTPYPPAAGEQPGQQGALCHALWSSPTKAQGAHCGVGAGRGVLG